jgi:hypothetical protein
MARVTLTILLITLVFLTSGAYSAQSADETALPGQPKLSRQSYSGFSPNLAEYTRLMAESPHGSSPGQSITLLVIASVGVSTAMGGLIYGWRFIAALVGE